MRLLKTILFLGFFFFNTNSLFAQLDTTKLRVIELNLCKDVIERQPIDIVSGFTTNDERAWAYARVYNSNGLTDIHFNWYLDNELQATIPVKIGNSSNWRTYSNINLQVGIWKIEVVDDEENVLKELRFNVSE